ncbi:MAG: hypothetical protein K2K70_00175, partial [Lachnospiraceae bacterium]|nr:hypothetical protein [Lachnospiraceae bacterium]
MYHYIQDKDFLKLLKGTCHDIVNQLVQSINNDSVMTVKACLVGSGAKNLITQNENEPIDLDYNLCIVSTKSINILDGHEIKEYVRKHFNKVLYSNGWDDCQDSTSAFTTAKYAFQKGNNTAFSIDIAIICKYHNNWQRLIHQKTGLVILDRYYWNEVQNSGKLEEKVRVIKSENLWGEVRHIYLDKKNFYLCRNDCTHPSFIIYVEAVNQI